MKRSILTVVLAASASACGGDYTAEPGTAFADFCGPALARVDSFITRMEAEQPPLDPERYGGTAVVGSISDLADGMNHFSSSAYESSQHQQHVNLMTLISYDPDLQPEPYLAESWELDDPENPTAITFHLRRDVLWHDGTPTTARDVEFTYLVATDTATAYPNAAFWDHYVRGPEGVEVVDSFTVRIRLRPHAEFLDPFSRLAIMPRHLLEGVPPAEIKQHPFGTQCPVGNGPFVFVEHRPNESWTFKANPAFSPSLGGRPYLDRYVLRIIPEQTTQLADLLTENIDVMIGVRPDQADRIIASPDLELLHYVSRFYTYVGWNARRPELADARVRRALTLAINRQEIVDAQLHGYGVVANSSVPPFHFSYDPGLSDSLAYDPDQARRLLEEAGWSDRDGDGVRENAEGHPFEIVVEYNQGNQQRQDIAEILQAQLALVGVSVQPQVVEFGTLIGKLMDPARDFDAVVFGWSVEFKLDDKDIFHSERIDQPYAFSGTSNPRMDHYMDTLQLVVDREDALPLWREYQQEVIREQPYTFVFFQERLDGVNRRLRDLRMDVRGEWINIREWWIPREERREAQRATGS